MKKVLHLAQFLKYGSSTGIIALIKQLALQNIQSELLLSYPCNGQEHSQDLLDKLLIKGIKISFIDSTFVRNSWNKQVLQKRILKKFPKENYHYITHGGFSAYALSELNLEFIHVCHGFGMNRPKHINNQDLIGIKSAKKCYGVSKDIIQQLLQLGVKKQKITLMYYPLNIKRRLALSPREIKKVGVVGNLISRKGQIYAIKSIQNLLNKKIELHIFGDGEDEILLKNYVLKYNLNRRIYFRGFCKVEDIFKQIDLLLVPSLSEGLGMVNLEAFLYGVPVIAFNSGGIGEIIKSNETGLLAKRKDIKDLSDKISYYLDNYKIAFKHTNEGFYLATQLFDPIKNMKDLFYVLKK
ncbi:MAG: hypothetical protein COB02_00280 [Candidatus Cloacimonadota bacterium]|nr:MAG: hypothetical protein COB02_00280 [Candidatus Cloacimonadota bacterium]